MSDGTAEQHGSMSVWNHIGRHSGAEAISLRVFKFDKGTSPSISNPLVDELLYVYSGRGTINLDGKSADVEAETAIYLSPGARLTVENPETEPVVMISSRCPEHAD